MKKRLYTISFATERSAVGWKRTASAYIAFHFGADAVNILTKEKDIEKPSSERKGDREAVEGVCVRFEVSHSPSVAYGASSLSEGAL